MWIGSALVQVMDCRQFGTKPPSEQMQSYCESDPEEKVKFESTIKTFHSWKCSVDCEIVPTWGWGVGGGWWPWCTRTLISEVIFLILSQSPNTSWRNGRSMGCFKVSHRLINWYVNTCGVDLCLHKLLGDTLQFDTQQPKPPLPLSSTPKSGIMQGCDHGIQIIYIASHQPSRGNRCTQIHRQCFLANFVQHNP